MPISCTFSSHIHLHVHRVYLFACVLSVVFRSLIGRPRNRKEADYVLIGNQLLEGDQYAPQRIKVRSPWEQTLVTQYDLMEYLCDYAFANLGLTANVPHPIFMTEPLCNPNYCRAKMSELLFECYGVPGVGYGVQELLAWDYNAVTNRASRASADDPLDGDCTGDALIVSCGYECSTVLPVIDSKPMFEHAARLSVGGAQLTHYLTHSLATIQHPEHSQQFNAHRVQQLVEEIGQCVPDSYPHHLNEMCRLYDIEGGHIPSTLPPTVSATIPEPIFLQLPFQPESTAIAQHSTAELQSKIERKELQRQRLRNLMAGRKEKKLAEDQETLNDWDALKLDLAEKRITYSEYMRQLKRRTFVDEEDFKQQ